MTLQDLRTEFKNFESLKGVFKNKTGYEVNEKTIDQYIQFCSAHFYSQFTEQYINYEQRINALEQQLIELRNKAS